jgi:hypothetical protein
MNEWTNNDVMKVGKDIVEQQQKKRNFKEMNGEATGYRGHYQ